MPSTHTTVLVVDDDASVIEALARWLRSHERRVLAATSASEALELLESQHVDVVVSDHQMPLMTGVELLTLISRRYPNTARVLLTGNATLSTAARAVNEGSICRLLLKPCPSEDVAAAVEDATRRAHLSWATERLVSAARSGDTTCVCPEALPSRSGDVSFRPESGPLPIELPDSFSRREREVLQLLARGARTAQIAQTLFLSEHTVRNHLKAMFRKAGVHSQAALVALARGR